MSNKDQNSLQGNNNERPIGTLIGMASIILMGCSILIGCVAIVTQMFGITVDLVALAVSLCGGGVLLQVPFWALLIRHR